jgi:large subunit ribosomal protein L30
MEQGMSDYIRILQIRSPIRRHYSQRRTLQGLGLNKIGRTVAVRFNGPMWGMIRKVRHLIRFPDRARLCVGANRRCEPFINAKRTLCVRKKCVFRNVGPAPYSATLRMASGSHA